MGISRRKLLVGTGIGAGVIAAGGGATLLTDNLPADPESLLRIDALPSDDPGPAGSIPARSVRQNRRWWAMRRRRG
ncbi:twin-arginine translocation signal domain-containing protein [Pantoea wallisii]|uniref:twin-arginine translocation signal domain-containing protein n=1 Tax=Pantoea wallisii TaxID=1076551 RepID=UPI000FFB2971|nr:twin-arginine translocation signal domain-containing protein [Pantoea wallisii]